MAAPKKTRQKKASRNYSHLKSVSAGLKWAEGVVDGSIVASKVTRLACERQLRDLKRKRFKYYFDAEEAQRVADCLELMPLVKGKWAAQRKYLKLSPWQAFFVTTVFGWLKKKNHKRRFRSAYICVARKNGKSALAAAIALYMMGLDGEYGPEIYSGATTEKQAWEVFKPARLMAKHKAMEDYRDVTGIQVNAKTLSRAIDGGKFEALIGDPGDGASPTCAIVDEYHEHKKPDLYNTMATGMGAREQPLLLTITTAGDDISRPCYRLQTTLIKILDGTAPKVSANDEKFALIFQCDDEDLEADNWTKPAALKKANPNMGISVDADYLKSAVETAIVDASEQNTVKNKHLNIWTSSRDAYYNSLNWRRCQNSRLNIEDFKGKDCIVTLDLSSKSDLTCKLCTFPVYKEKLHYYLFPTFYLPAETILNDSSKMYQTWFTEKQLRQTEGYEVDMQVVKNDVLQDMEDFNVMEVGYDPWRAAEMARALEDDGAQCVIYRNTTGNMSEPMKETKAAIDSKRVHHDGNEIMTWCISNIVAQRDANSNVFPRKKDDANEHKIDGGVCFIMAAGRLMYQEAEENLDDWLNSEPISG